MAELTAEVLHTQSEVETINESSGGASIQTGNNKKPRADGNPANQFGRHAHSVLVRFAEQVHKDLKDSNKKPGSS
jgi:hypothetical protein